MIVEHPKGPTMWVERCTVCSYDGGGTASFILPRNAEADKDVAGYFQLSDLAQFTSLQALLPQLQSMPGIQIIRQLRADKLRWHIKSLKRWQAVRYAREAQDHGYDFIIVA